jgi:cysteinyl-tRNA synthetase
MDDDFNTPRVIAHIFDLIGKINPLTVTGKIGPEDAQIFLGMLDDFNQVLGIIPEKIEETPREVQKLVDEREFAREQKDFKTSDRLREQIKNLGYEVDDTIYGPLLRRRR